MEVKQPLACISYAKRQKFKAIEEKLTALCDLHRIASHLDASEEPNKVEVTRVNSRVIRRRKY